MTGRALTRQNNVVITGTLTEHAALTFLDLAAFTVSFPTTTQGDKNLGPDQQLTLAPGSYGNVTVKSRAQLFLRAGTYYMTSLSSEPGAAIRLNSNVGRVFLYVKNAFTHKGAFIDSRGRDDDLLVGYFGTTIRSWSPASQARWSHRRRARYG